MKLLRISLLFNYLKNTSNQKKFLRYINIGIFFSIFAISSAIITFYIETKIDKLEFELTELHIEQRDTKRTIKDFMAIKTVLKSIIVSDKALDDLYEYTASTKLGNYMITVDDLYLPTLFIETAEGNDMEELATMFSEYSEYVSEWFGKDSKELKDFTEATISMNENIDFYDTDYSKYHERIFDYGTKNVTNQILSKKTSVNYYDDHKFYREYKKLNTIYYNLFLTLEIIEKMLFEWMETSKNDSSKINIEILNLSKNESLIIIFAFIFQFIVFLIIQYFEITSINNERKGNAKRKIK